MSTKPIDTSSYGLSTGRLEALSDGVLSVAITLLVLNFADVSDEFAKLPTISNWQMITRLVALWPHLFGYTLTFVLVAIYWLLHHMIFQRVHVATRTLVWLNVMFLLLTTFLPFPTDVMAECFLHESNAVVALFGMAHAAAGISLIVLWTYAKRNKLLVADLDQHTAAAITRALWIGPTFNLLGIFVSAFSTVAALVVYAMIPVIYIVQPRLDRPWHWVSRASHSNPSIAGESAVN